MVRVDILICMEHEQYILQYCKAFLKFTLEYVLKILTLEHFCQQKGGRRGQGFDAYSPMVIFFPGNKCVQERQRMTMQSS